MRKASRIPQIPILTNSEYNSYSIISANIITLSHQFK